MKFLLTAALTLLAVLPLIAQQNQFLIDSLLKKLPHAENDSTRARIYHRLSILSQHSEPAASEQYARQGMALTKQMHWSKGIAQFYTLLGNVYSDRSNYEEAERLYRQSYALNKQINHELGIAVDLINMGTNKHRQIDFVKALDYYFQALPVAQKIEDAGKEAIILNNIAGVYVMQDNEERGIYYSRKALELHQRLQNNEGIATAFGSIGNLFNTQGQTDSAFYYYARAIQLFESIGNIQGKAIIYGQLGANSKSFNEKIDYELKAKALWDSINPSHENAITNIGNLGADYLTKYKHLRSIEDQSGTPKDSMTTLLAESERLLRESITRSEEAGDNDNAYHFAGILSSLLYERKQYKEAYLRLKLSHEGTDSIFSQENKNRIAAIESKQAIALRDQQLQINRLTINSQRQQRSLLIAGIAILCCLATGLYILSKVRKRTAFKLQVLNKELDEANKTKAMFFAILSHDLRGPVSSLISLTELEEASAPAINNDWAVRNRKLITDRGKSLLNTMDTLLFWSKGQMKQFQLMKESFPVSRLFGELSHAFQWEDRTIITFSNREALMIHSDPNYCRIIMHNLTANSIKILKDVPHGHIVWTASALPGQVQLSITDNGPGMATAAMQTLQYESVTANTQTGFGLHMVRDLAKAIDCRIEVDAQPGVGTTIRLFFKS